MLRRLIKNTFHVFAALFVIEIALRLSTIPTYILPTPSTVFMELVVNWQPLLGHTAITYLEASFGLLIALSLAGFLAIAIAALPRFSASVTSGLVILQSIPVIAFGPILNSWFGSGIFPKSILAASICLPPIALTVLRGLQSVTRDELLVYKGMGANKMQIFLMLRLPRAVPSLITSLRIGIPLATLGAIVGEFVGSQSGLGFYIMTSSYYVRTDAMFSAILVAGCINLIAVAVVSWIGASLSWEKYVIERD